MHLRTILASLAACGIACSALSVPASAAILNSNHPDGHFMVSLESILPEGNTPADVYGVRVLLDGKPHGNQSIIGGICWQSDTREWQQKEYGQPEERRPLVYDINTDTITMVLDAPLFDADEVGCEIFVAEWSWENDNQANFLVRNVKVLDANGNELQPKAVAKSEPVLKDKPPTPPTPHDDKPAPKDDKPTPPQDNPAVKNETPNAESPVDDTPPAATATPTDTTEETESSEVSSEDSDTVETTESAAEDLAVDNAPTAPQNDVPDNAQHDNQSPLMTIKVKQTDSASSVEEEEIVEPESGWKGAMLGICIAVGGLIVAGVAAIFACKKV